jgi:hypothetical protein
MLMMDADRQEVVIGRNNTRATESAASSDE